MPFAKYAKSMPGEKIQCRSLKYVRGRFTCQAQHIIDRKTIRTPQQLFFKPLGSSLNTFYHPPCAKFTVPLTFVSIACASSFDSTSEGKLSTEEPRKLFRKAVSLIDNAEKLLAHDPSKFSLPLALWDIIADIPKDRRSELLKHLSSNNIEKLWHIAGQKYSVHPQVFQNSKSSSHSLWNDFPTTPKQVTVFKGKANLPIFNKFKKVLFLHPKTYELYGHVDVGSGILGRLIFPLYFKADLSASLFPGADELTDLHFDYLPLEKLALAEHDVPKEYNLPPPGQPKWPFNKNLRDFMRIVGPGVFVGRGWKQSLPAGGSGQGSSFLHFVLIKA